MNRRVQWYIKKYLTQKSMRDRRTKMDEDMQKTNIWQNGKCKSHHINNCIKYEWSKNPHQKAEIVRADKKARYSLIMYYL